MQAKDNSERIFRRSRSDEGHTYQARWSCRCLESRLRRLGCAPAKRRRQTRSVRRPPFSKEIRAALTAGRVSLVFAFVGRSAWVRARRYAPGSRLVIPPPEDTPLEQLDFTDLRGLDVVLNAHDSSSEFAESVARRICSHGARLCVLLHPALPGESKLFSSVLPS